MIKQTKGFITLTSLNPDPLFYVEDKNFNSTFTRQQISITANIIFILNFGQAHLQKNSNVP